MAVFSVAGIRIEWTLFVTFCENKSVWGFHSSGGSYPKYRLENNKTLYKPGRWNRRLLSLSLNENRNYSAEKKLIIWLCENNCFLTECSSRCSRNFPHWILTKSGSSDLMSVCRISHRFWVVFLRTEILPWQNTCETDTMKHATPLDWSLRKLQE